MLDQSLLRSSRVKRNNITVIMPNNYSAAILNKFVYGESGGAVALTGSISAVSAVNGSVLLNYALTGAISAEAGVNGQFYLIYPLSGVINAVSGITGQLLKSITLSGDIGAVSDAEGVISKLISFNGSAEAYSILSAMLSKIIDLSGEIDAVSNAREVIRNILIVLCESPIALEFDIQSGILQEHSQGSEILNVNNISSYITKDVSLASVISREV